MRPNIWVPNIHKSCTQALNVHQSESSFPLHTFCVMMVSILCVPVAMADLAPLRVFVLPSSTTIDGAVAGLLGTSRVTCLRSTQ